MAEITLPNTEIATQSRDSLDVQRKIMKHVTIRVLAPHDAEVLSSALLSSPPDYMRFFHPFDFGVASVRRQLEKGKLDTFFGLQTESAGERELAGFYMMRGLDEGYPQPMYGVYVAHKYWGKGLARLTLVHAEIFCALNNYERILLKVHPDNVRAKKLYESVGFHFLREESISHEHVLCKELQHVETKW
jgi:ribosomal protein S18 acetylase RimI-like enzyme